MYKELDTIAL